MAAPNSTRGRPRRRKGACSGRHQRTPAPLAPPTPTPSPHPGGGPGAGVGRGAGFANRGKRVPKPRIGKTSIKGALDKDVIRRVVRAHINEVRHCYNQGLARDPNLKGRVKIQFQIGGTGKVPMAVIQEDTVKDGKVGRCISKAVRRWKFPRPRDGGMVLVTYPFLLSST